MKRQGARRRVGLGFAVSCDLVLRATLCWALVLQYPYPERIGVISLALLSIITPVLSIAMLWRAARSGATR